MCLRVAERNTATRASSSFITSLLLLLVSLILVPAAEVFVLVLLANGSSSRIIHQQQGATIDCKCLQRLQLLVAWCTLEITWSPTRSFVLIFQESKVISLLIDWFLTRVWDQARIAAQRVVENAAVHGIPIVRLNEKSKQDFEHGHSSGSEYWFDWLFVSWSKTLGRCKAR